MTLDDYLRSHRLTLEQLADQVGCDVSTLSRIRAGKVLARRTTALKIEQGTGGLVTWRDLLGVAADLAVPALRPDRRAGALALARRAGERG